VAHRPLAEDILANAVKAGFEDPRFKPVTEDEIRASEIEVAVLSHPAEMAFESEDDLLSQLVPGRDGLILTSQGKRGTFLPKVWEALETPAQFLNGLKVKAGLPRDHWAGDVQVQRYVTEAFKGRIGKAA
jgi:AmmeMemoRadiSam system protein A